MAHALITSLMAALLLAGGRAPGVPAQATSIPISLAVTATPSEIKAGETATAEVRLKNFRGDTLAAPNDVTVTLHSELSGDASVRFKAGQSVAATELRFLRGGVANLVATAPNMTSGTTAVVVQSLPTVDSQTSSSLASAASSAPSSKVILAVQVLPDHVHPSNASWQAKVLVTAVNESRQPIPVQVETSIQLDTDAGVVTPTFATIRAGHARTTEHVQLTSTRPGAGTLWAWTDAGDLGQAAVEYHNAMPSLLSVKALPTRTLNDGRTAINVTVFLQDETSGAAKAEEDMQVKLTSSVGTPKPSILSIAKGQFVGEAILTSASAGVAEITATAPGMQSGVARVEFVFPYLLVLCAGIGGVIGALMRSNGVAFKGARWWWHLLGSLSIGSVLGLLVYLLAVFGIVASIPKLSIPLGELPTTNEFAAAVLGFFGGYYARTWIPNPAEAEPHERGPRRLHPAA